MTESAIDPRSSLDEVRDYIARLQRDGRLLLRHIARRPEAVLPETPLTSTAPDTRPPNVLFSEPETVRKDPASVVQLLRCVDDLSRRAAPANVRSIRLTSSYLKIAVEGGEPPIDIISEANRIRLYVQIVSAICVVFFLGSVGLLAHIDYGRKLLQQINILRQQEQDLLRDVVALPLTESVLKDSRGPIVALSATPPNATKADGAVKADMDGDGVPLCRNTLEKTGGGGDPALDHPLVDRWREPVTQKAAGLCRRVDDIRLRLALAYSGLSDWNCTTKRIMSLYLRSAENACTIPNDLPPGVDGRSWKSHESWVSTSTAVVAGFVLPMMLGCLGGCAYVLRRIDQKLSNWTLEPHDGTHALARVMLAALIGGLVGVIWTTGDNVTLGGFTLSLAAIAFFVGFSVEVVFKVIENLILNVTSTLGSSPPTAALVPQVPRPTARALAQ